MPTTPDFIPPLFIDYTAVFLWATSGAIVGWRKGYDIVGVFVIALVSAVGGSLLRDGLLLQRIPPIGTNVFYLLLIALATLMIAILGRNFIGFRHWRKVVSVIDALATPMFIVVGAQLAISRGLPLSGIILSAALSGVGGGLLRDVLAGDTPELLRPGQYNTLLVVIAALLFIALDQYAGVNANLAAWTIIGLFFIARLAIIRFNWRSRPVSEFEVTRVVGEITNWLPRWGKADAQDLVSHVDEPEPPGMRTGN